jgi:hypothetical protein
VEDKDLYIRLGEIQKSLELCLKNQETNFSNQINIDRRMAAMEQKINYAIGVVAAVIFFFQAGWTYLTKMGKA